MRNNESATSRGVCYLIGAGPGDPGLLTRRAEQCLRLAEVIYYDFLVSDEIMALANPDAERICVGKAAGNHSVSQDEINRLLVESVTQGKVTARIKGGDPFVFGRGGEEALALSRENLDFEVIPGVTSGIAAAAYAGIPVTHRGISTAVTFVTGHETPDKPECQTDWEALARGSQTICIYMGTGNVSKITSALIEAGRNPSQPAALISCGTLPHQQTLFSTLADLPADMKKSGLSTPGMIVIGDVCSLHEELSWRKTLPLSGKTVMVTRATHQASKLSALFSQMGARVIESPAIRIIPVETCCSSILDYAIRDGLVKIAHMREKNPLLLSILQESPLTLNLPPFDELIGGCDSVTKAVAYLVANHHDWVVFTSVNGVEQLWNRLDDFGLDARVFVGKEIAAIGPSTSQALYERGLHADLIPDTYTTHNLLESLCANVSVKGKKFLLLRASNAPELLREELILRGAEVDDLVGYHVGKAQLSSQARKALVDGHIDAITFASAATARNFYEMTGDILPEIMHLSRRPKMISIGPVTSEEMKKLGIPPDAQAPSSTIADLALSTACVFNCPGNNSHP